MHNKGHIKEFLYRNKSKLPNMLWLELSSNNTQLIRLSNLSTVDQFKEDLMDMKLKEAAAHLLSLTIRERDSKRLPISRLQSIMGKWFSTLKESNMNENSPYYAIEQIMNFLNLLPFPFSSSILRHLIFIPAEDLFHDYKLIMWELAKNNLLFKLHLEELGLILGIHEWTQDLYNEVTYPSEKSLVTTMDNYPQLSMRNS